MREVRIRDTLSGETRPIEATDGVVGIYACGPTVYSRIHIGNARPYVVFSLLSRFLRSEGYETKLVINVTDVNDKIYAAAKREGVPSAEWAARMTQAYVADTDALGLGRPDAEPLATERVAGIIALIEELIGSDHAYEADGDVYFRVRSFDGYGKLSNRDPDQMDQGEESGSALAKESRLDFALWKANKPGEDTSWDSPWGPGRPAWHIECSVMAEEELGSSFSLHGGGSDLVFPHHENEIAQSESAGHSFSHLWMHNGMVQTGSEKMSKSEGNIFQLSEALDRFGPEAVVAYLVSGHYRQPLAFGEGPMEEAVARVERIRNFLRDHPVEESAGDPAAAARVGAFRDALADDFNTPKALAVLFELIAEARREAIPWAASVVLEMLTLLGLESIAEAESKADSEAEGLMLEREQARAAKDFGRADQIRDRLAELGWTVRDSADGPSLVPKV
jgi:cysteinyl-tRNA synthetase